MILSVCPDPYIDVNLEVDYLRVGMCNKIKSKRIFYTGKALNAAIGLARLDCDAFVTGFMYEENGNMYEQQLHKEGVPYKFVWNKGRVRENYKFIDHRSMLTEADELNPEISKDKQTELLTLIGQISNRSEGIIVSGELARGCDNEFFYKILQAVPESAVKVVDTDGERLLQALKCGVDLVKPNIEELERTLKVKIVSEEDMINACRKILDMGSKYILLSLGKQGAVISDGNRFYHCKSVNVAMNSTIGAGDGMVAAAANALIRGGDMQEILRCGVAGGTASVTLPDSISFTKDKYEEILSSLSVTEILK